MFFAQFERLCALHGTKPSKVTVELGYSTGSMSYWKKGNEPSGDILIKFAHYFDVTTDYLLGLSENPSSADFVLSFEEVQIVEAYRKNEDVQNAVKRLLKIPEQEAEKQAQDLKIAR